MIPYAAMAVYINNTDCQVLAASREVAELLAC
jgi:hypothetical protein